MWSKFSVWVASEPSEVIAAMIMFLMLSFAGGVILKANIDYNHQVDGTIQYKGVVIIEDKERGITCYKQFTP